MPDGKALAAIASHLGVTVDWLLGLHAAVGDSRVADAVAEAEGLRRTLESVGVRLRGALQLVDDVLDYRLDLVAVLLMRAEALRQDPVLEERHGRGAWLAVAESLADELVARGQVSEEDLDLFRAWCGVAESGLGDLPSVTWRDVGISEEELQRGA